METEIIKSKRSYQVVESQTYTDSINFFAVKKTSFCFCLLIRVQKKKHMWSLRYLLCRICIGMGLVLDICFRCPGL